MIYNNDSLMSENIKQNYLNSDCAHINKFEKMKFSKLMWIGYLGNYILSNSYESFLDVNLIDRKTALKCRKSLLPILFAGPSLMGLFVAIIAVLSVFVFKFEETNGIFAAFFIYFGTCASPLVFYFFIHPIVVTIFFSQLKKICNKYKGPTNNEILIWNSKITNMKDFIKIYLSVKKLPDIAYRASDNFKCSFNQPIRINYEGSREQKAKQYIQKSETANYIMLGLSYLHYKLAPLFLFATWVAFLHQIFLKYHFSQLYRVTLIYLLLHFFISFSFWVGVVLLILNPVYLDKDFGRTFLDPNLVTNAYLFASSLVIYIVSISVYVVLYLVLLPLKNWILKKLLIKSLLTKISVGSMNNIHL